MLIVCTPHIQGFMNRIVVALAVAAALSLVGCNRGAARPCGSTAVAASNPDPAHNSRNSLDWAGTYSGTVPCADCEGIATRLTLRADGTFTLQTQYLGKSEEIFSRQGTFTWDGDDNHILLQGIDGGPNKYLVGEGRLIQRDIHGAPITGDLAAHYVLHLTATDPTSASVSSLEGTHWKLVELMGKPVPAADDDHREAHIVLDAEERLASGNAGCNRFFASYELDAAAGRLRFGMAGGTMMACPDMSIEQAFHQALPQVDNYAIGADGTLSLHRARMAPLMRFTAVTR